jgi:hypothetical protein
MSEPVRVPANVDQPDRLLAGLTARQLAILAATTMLLYLAWAATRTVIPLPAFLVLALPIGATAALLALGQRDGLSLDRLALAAIRQHLQPRYRVAAPEGVRPAPAWLTSQVHHTARTAAGRGTGARTVPDISPTPLRLPADGVTETGVIDLGHDGVAVVAVASTVNFALRTPAEQEALVASFARYLHSLTAPLQVLIRAERLDLSAQIAELRQVAGGLPHPALEQAALQHADYLDQLRLTRDLLRRQVLLVLREPVRDAGLTEVPGRGVPLAGWVRNRHATRREEVDDAATRAAEIHLARRLTEAIELAPPGITVTALDAAQTTAVLAAACDPDSLIPPSADMAAADDVITGVITGGVTTTAPTDHDTTRRDSADWDDWDDRPTDRDRSDGTGHDPGDRDHEDFDEDDWDERHTP